jgi:hypothetical protein
MSDKISTIQLPAELRIRIYRYIFIGKRLSYYDYLDEEDSTTERSTCNPILFVSKATYAESRPVLLDTIQVDATESMDTYYPTLASLVLTPSMIRHLYLNTSALSERVNDARSETIAMRCIQHCLQKMDALQSLTYALDHDSQWIMGPGSIVDGWISENGVSSIRKHPRRMIGWDCRAREVRAILLAWHSKQKSFELFAETRVWHVTSSSVTNSSVPQLVFGKPII